MHQSSGYIPSIDGLRAVAVLAVVAYHVGVPGFDGGYIGVDVFFVISGFLITNLLYRELVTTGRIDILEFYARRVRRLLPAYALVLFATLLMGMVLLSPVREQPQLAQTAVSASLFVSNIYFWRTQAGYFTGPADEVPLVHTWTLATEEQFYLVWPLAMLIAAATARRLVRPLSTVLLVALVAASLISCAAAIALTSSKPTLTFYMLPFRFWELGLGALIAIAPRPTWLVRRGDALSAGGLLAIGFGTLTINPASIFPGYLALIPTIGAAAVIVGVISAPQTAAAAMLASRPMTEIGRLSYGWYLWHWPLLAIARASSLGERVLWRDLALAVVALVLAKISLTYLETPIRSQRWRGFSSKLSSIGSGIALLLTTVVAAFLLETFSRNQLAGNPALLAAEVAGRERFDYPTSCTHFELPFRRLAPRQGCEIGAAASNEPRLDIVVWGDSHAFHFLPAIDTAARDLGLRALPRAMGFCRPDVMSPVPADGGRLSQLANNCRAFNEAVLATLPDLRAAGVSTVVLAARWSHPLAWEGARAGDWAPSLSALLITLKGLGFSVVLVPDVPGFDYDVPQCVARRGIDGCNILRSAVDLGRSTTLARFRALADKSEGVVTWDPIKAFCDRDTCRAANEKVVNYSDRQHLSVRAASVLADDLKAFLAQNRLVKSHK